MVGWAHRYSMTATCQNKANSVCWQAVSRFCFLCVFFLSTEIQCWSLFVLFCNMMDSGSNQNNDIKAPKCTINISKNLLQNVFNYLQGAIMYYVTFTLILIFFCFTVCIIPPSYLLVPFPNIHQCVDLVWNHFSFIRGKTHLHKNIALVPFCGLLVPRTCVEVKWRASFSQATALSNK